MKFLVVLDDVSDQEQLEILIETLDWFGRGSRNFNCCFIFKLL
jgi:hypothetical protein